jgi:RNA polymerase-associated protein RTF1
MADIDEELLLLAGEASSDEDDAPMNISRDTSVSRNERKTEPSSKANNARKSVGKNASRRGNQDDSEEEGEA